MSTYELVDSLPLEVESYELEGLTSEVSSGFTRRTTVISLHGNGADRRGGGRDLRRGGAGAAPARGLRPRPRRVAHDRLVLRSSSGSLDLFPGGAPEHDAWRNYRRWGFESAALDLALRQAGRPLADALGREARPVTFVFSLRHRRAARPRPRPAPAGDVPGHALQARPDEGLGRRARRAARRARRRGHRRPQGRLPRHGGGQPGRSGAVPARRRGLPARVDRGPRPAERRRPRGARAAPRPGHVGRASSTRSTTSRGSRSRPEG